MSKPTLALCIPAYNAAAYLPRLLKSAEAQLIPFDEILVYNDCSTDATAEVAKQYGATVVEGDVNRGCSFGKNKLAEVTKCDWIHFHDADDELLPNFTTLAHRWMRKEDCPDVVLFDYEWREHDSNRLLSVRRFDRIALENDPIRYAILEQINPFCGLYRKSKFLAAGGYDLDPLVLYNEDVAMHCSLAIHGLRFSSESEVSIINYRIGNSMSSANQLKCAQAHFHVMRKNAEKVGSKYTNEIAAKLWANAGILMSYSDWPTARQAIRLAAKLNGKVSSEKSFIIRFFSPLNPYWAFILREYLIRIFKPSLRKR